MPLRSFTLYGIVIPGMKPGMSLCFTTTVFLSASLCTIWPCSLSSRVRGLHAPAAAITNMKRGIRLRLLIKEPHRHNKPAERKRDSAQPHAERKRDSAQPQLTDYTDYADLNP